MTTTKTPCTISRSEFRAVAKPLEANIAGTPVFLTLAGGTGEFSTRSLGWNANGKLTIKLPNGQHVVCQLGINLTVVNSKEAVEGNYTAPASNGAAGATPQLSEAARKVINAK